jgi:hypothetical protein
MVQQLEESNKIDSDGQDISVADPREFSPDPDYLPKIQIRNRLLKRPVPFYKKKSLLENNLQHFNGFHTGIIRMSIQSPFW